MSKQSDAHQVSRELAKELYKNTADEILWSAKEVVMERDADKIFAEITNYENLTLPCETGTEVKDWIAGNYDDDDNANYLQSLWDDIVERLAITEMSTLVTEYLQKQKMYTY